MGNRPIKLNIGCGSKPLPDYVNIDSDDLDTLLSRYPSRQFDESIKIFQYDIFNLPYDTIYRPASFSSPCKWNNTKSAKFIATTHDGNPCIYPLLS